MIDANHAMQGLLVLVLVVLLALLAARAWAALRGRKGSPAESTPPAYTVKESLLGTQERAFLEILQRVTG